MATKKSASKKTAGSEASAEKAPAKKAVAKKVAAKKTVAKTTTAEPVHTSAKAAKTQPTQHDISVRAYLLWERDGKKHGHHDQYWQQAEKELHE